MLLYGIMLTVAGATLAYHFGREAVRANVKKRDYAEFIIDTIANRVLPMMLLAIFALLVSWITLDILQTRDFSWMAIVSTSKPLVDVISRILIGFLILMTEMLVVVKSYAAGNNAARRNQNQ